ncbi:AAA family ATPase [Rhodococcus sp. D2-41]|uniref:UDP-N-acetylglucosamine kinase n=1 Tax=Speluncibacter jeojiensis TaxID=2710754 RepID=A0A9X4RG66_9ACTN|nr:zeta toxin family protein [Rhodococcus sp. D2-41]MDG3010704.1 AAA family ATPase [Rhodococcus sp. D2-41]MDG3013686.1 zeta toxin family protein [Corynebacteriales bacterium D3-21]
MRRLDLVVGPNGAGKSTFIDQRLAPLLPGSLFVNADVIAKDRWPDAPEEHSYEAARIAATIRDALIAQGESFIAETVFSHPSKLGLIDRAHRAGYVVVLHVVLVPVELSVARVAERVIEGGHRVPEDKIRGRFERLWPLVADAIARVDHATVYDNTAPDVTRIVARYVDGDPVGAAEWPRWAPAELVG